MKQLIYVTGNKDKFTDGQQILKQYGYDAVQKKLKIDELQLTDGELIARHKAQQAFDLLQKPLFVNDTTWHIPAINNFPGAFMKYVNETFTPEDWLRLMKDVDDRRVIMREILVFKDTDDEVVFFHDVEGTFLFESSGVDGVTSDKVITMRKDSKSIAAARDENIFTTKELETTSYDLLGKWLNANR